MRVKCQTCGKEFDDSAPPAGACQIEAGTGVACSIVCAELAEGADSGDLLDEEDD